MTDAAHRNRLARETSPYLLQHAGNPVDWYPWGEEALARARQEQRPIFLSIGYAACHWCHVMEHESFEDDQVAEFLNRHFVAVKVDREERPDLDAVYMAAVQALTGSGGWPLSVFLTPDLRAFYGGTYFPPEPRWGRPSFLEVLGAVEQAWSDRRDQVLESADEIAEHLASSTRDESGDLDAQSAAGDALTQLQRSHDPVWGGFGAAPKFPTPSRLFFLVERAANGDRNAYDLLARTLDGMAAGGMWDWVGGGFHRYSVDGLWLVPHFEKMLYDNALLARAYGEAGVRLDEPRWVEVARRTADYLVREMQGPEGGFYSSTDADSEGEEGRYFTWTADEVRQTLADDQAEAVVVVCGLENQPNFENGRHVLRPVAEPEQAARRLGIDEATLSRTLEEAKAALYRARAGREAPLLDDKRLAGWNGMAIWSLAWLGATLDEPRYLEAASRAADFAARELVVDGGSIVRSWREGARSGAETLEDLAWLTAGMIELYQADGDIGRLRIASSLVRDRLPRYQDSDGTLYETADDGEKLPLRPRSSVDGATPANAAVLIRSLTRLAALTGDADLAERAARSVRAEAATARRFAAGATSLICAALELAKPATELVIVGDPTWPSTRSLLAVARRAAVPPLVLAVTPTVPPPAGLAKAVPLFEGRESVEGERAVAYLCSAGACELPTADAGELAARLAPAERR